MGLQISGFLFIYTFILFCVIIESDSFRGVENKWNLSADGQNSEMEREGLF